MRLGPRQSGTNKPSSSVATLLAVIVLTSLAACGGGASDGAIDGAGSQSSGSRAPDAQSASGTTVTIKDFVFKPEGLSVKAGTAVKVVNADDTEHTLTANDRSFDTGTVKGGGHASVTPAKAGKAGYFCEIHDYMKGTFDVG